MASITTRNGKGSALTHVELDANFTNLNNGKLEVATASSTYLPLTGGTLTGGLTFAAGQATATVSSPNIVQLTDSTSSTSTTTAATPNSVKSAFDLANAALPKAGGSLTGIVNLNATHTGPAFTITQFGSGAGLKVTQAGTGDAFLVEDQAADTTPFVIKDDGRVGIGTSAPGTLLDVVGSITGGSFIPASSSVPTNGVYLPAANTVGVATNGSGRLFVDASGNVGVGATPTSQFELTSALPTLRWRDTTDNSYAELLNNNGALSIRADEGNVGSSSYIDFRIDGSERLRITSAGNVGIGTTNPAFKLDVSHSGDNNAARFYQSGASANTDIYINNVGSANNFIISRRSNGESWLFNSGTDPLVFLTNATERARIDSSGRLLVGTSSAIGDAFNTSLGVCVLQAAGGNGYSIGIHSKRVDAFSNALVFTKSRDSSWAAVQNGDRVGYISFQGADGVKPLEAASISAEIDGVVSGGGVNDMPGRLVFLTTADGTAGPTERMRITNTGDINVDSGTFYVDATNNRVGLGTTAPVVPLHIVNSTSATYFRITADDAATNGDKTVNIEALKSGIGYHNLLFNANSHIFSINSTGAEKARIDSSGRLLVGTSSVYSVPTGDGGIRAPGLQRVATTFADSSISSTLFNTATEGGGTITLSRSNTTTLGAQAIAASQDATGSIWFSASDGVTQIPTASIVSRVDGTPGANDMPGRLVFSTTADGASTPTERMRITNAGNVGIGTTLPGFPLQVTGTIGATPKSTNSGFLLLSGNVGAAAGCTIESSFTSGGYGPLSFKVNNAEAARIDSSGRLLVGTSSAITGAYSSTGKLQSISTESSPYYAGSFYGYHNDTNPTIVQIGHSRSASPGHTILQNNDAFGALRFEGSDGVGFIEGASIIAAVDGTPGTNDMPGRLVFATTADGAASPTERLRITSAGNVGIGTGAPAAKLDVIGDIKASNYGIGATSNDAGSVGLISAANGPSIQFWGATTGQAGAMIAIAGAAERLRITSTGNVGIGTTSPGTTLNVNGTARFQNAASFAGINILNANDSSLITTTSFLDASNNLGTIDGHLFIEHLTTGGSNAVIATTPAGDRSVDRRVSRLIISSGGTTTLNSAASTAPLITQINGAEAARIDSVGRLLIGTSSARTNFNGNTTVVQVEATNSFASGISVVSNRITTDADYSAFLRLGRSGTTAFGSNDLVASGNRVGSINFCGADGTNLLDAAAIYAEIDGTPGLNDMPGRLVFATTADNASSPTERLRIDSTGLSAFTGSVRVRAASTQDAVVLAGRAGGSSSYAVRITPTTLTDNRTLTLADGDTTLVAGTMVPTSGATMTGFLTLNAAPTSNLHAATKLYVDEKAASTATVGQVLALSIALG